MSRCRIVDEQLAWGGDNIEASVEVFFISPKSLDIGEIDKENNSSKKNCVHLEITRCSHAIIVKQLTKTIRLGSLPTPSKLGSEGSHKLMNDKKKRKDLGFKNVREVKVRKTSRKVNAKNHFYYWIQIYP